MDGYTMRDYGRMIRDERRTRPWEEALLQAVTPGCTVLEIGTSIGYFAFLAVRAGAGRVYAVEPDDAIEVARRSASLVPGGDRIQWIQGISTEIELPERVDLVIGDLHGLMPFYTSNIISIIDARERHLKPGGKLIPARDRLYLVPAESPEQYLNLEQPWSRNDHGFDLAAGRSYVANNWWRIDAPPVDPATLLAPKACWGVIEYATVESTDLENTVEFVIERAGTLHGFYLWYDGEMADGIGFSNSPTLPELPYGRAFVPLETAVAVDAGDRAEVLFSARLVRGTYFYRWDTRVTDAAGAVKAQFRQSTFKSKVILPDKLRKSGTDYVPTLNPEGAAVRFVLEAMAGSRPLRDIAAALAERFPERFPTEERAMQETVRLSEKYG